MALSCTKCWWIRQELPPQYHGADWTGRRNTDQIDPMLDASWSKQTSSQVTFTLIMPIHTSMIATELHVFNIKMHYIYIYISLGLSQQKGAINYHNHCQNWILHSLSVSYHKLYIAIPAHSLSLVPFFKWHDQAKSPSNRSQLLQVLMSCAPGSNSQQ